ncbi:MAG TPA: hypothetical protein VM262_19650 [Acidimicrobiales bacterium]|nr:hypothetical protein [Acidimicrobiales bacterium]
MLLWLPAAFAGICGLLALATLLESQRARVAVRLSVRSAKATPEQAERLVALELERVLHAHGFDRSDHADHGGRAA